MIDTKMAKPVLVSSTRSPSSRQKQTLDRWIDEALNDPDKGGRHCTRIVLVHMQGANGQRELHCVTLGEGSGKTPKMLANMFEGKASNYSQDLPGLQTFNLLAFYGDATEPEAFHPFSLAGEHFHPGLSTEAPNAEGITQMLMRHLEIKEKLQTQERVSTSDTLMQMIEFLSKALIKAQEENAEAFAIMKEIMLEKTLNQHDLKMKELAFARSTSERDKLAKIIPGLVNTVSGREVFPQSTVDTQILEGIVEHADLETIQKMAGGKDFPPELVAMVMGRFTEIQEAKNKEAERARILAAQSRSLSADPEAEAAGDPS